MILIIIGSIAAYFVGMFTSYWICKVVPSDTLIAEILDDKSVVVLWPLIWACIPIAYIFIYLIGKPCSKVFFFIDTKVEEARKCKCAKEFRKKNAEAFKTELTKC